MRAGWWRPARRRSSRTQSSRRRGSAARSTRCSATPSGWPQWPPHRAAWRGRTPPRWSPERCSPPPLDLPASGEYVANRIRHCRIAISPHHPEEEEVEPSYSLGQRALAETLGTALLVLVGPGSVVATLVLAGDAKPAITGSDLLGISFAFGFIIPALVYALGRVWGCHITPAVTFALAATKRFPWRELPTYWAAQVVGAVLGALGIWAMFTQTGIDLGMGQTSFNEATTSWGSAIFAEGIGTFMLMLAILGIVDARSPGDFAGIVIGGVVVAIIMVVGPVTGASLNPARAFGPEFVSALGGGPTHWGQLIPVYIIPGLIGSALAAFAYDYMTTVRTKVQLPIREAVTHPDGAGAVDPTPVSTH